MHTDALMHSVSIELLGQNYNYTIFLETFGEFRVTEDISAITEASWHVLA
jgi:hypothetical protein